MLRTPECGLAIGRLAAILLIALHVACGSDSPVQPGPIVQPPPQPQPANQAPVITGITVAAERVEVDTDVAVTATVQDAETPVEQLRYEWRAEVGQFSGEGASVRWRAPKGAAPTPADVRFQLTVTETYGVADASGTRPEHVVRRDSPAVRLHDSNQEVSELALAFLRDFADSRVPPDVAVRHFSDSCPGKQAELDDLRKNRRHYQITDSRLSVQSVRFNGDRTRADVAAPCAFTSRVVECHPEIANCSVGMSVSVDGICALEARYERQRWWLCESLFRNPAGLVPGLFFGE